MATHHAPLYPFPTDTSEYAIDPVTEARGWLDDCFDGLDGSDYPGSENLTDDEVAEAIERHYHGGMVCFLIECR